MPVIIESEVKIVLSKEELNAVKRMLPSVGFRFKNKEKISDYFIEIEKSKNGGWDFERIRCVDNKKYFLTLKKWILDANKKKIRQESESVLAQKAALKKIANSQLYYKKERTNYCGKYEKNKAVISIDIMRKKSKKYRYLEVEVISDKENSYKIRTGMKKWLLKTFNLKNREEAPSMLDIISKDFL